MAKKERKKKNPGDHAEGWINVHDDNAMRKAGFLRPYNISPRDLSVWTKTKKEKEALKRAKSRYAKK